MLKIASVATIEPLALPLKDARASLGNISHQTIYNLINAGQLETAKIGGRRVVLVESMKALIERSKVKAA